MENQLVIQVASTVEDYKQQKKFILFFAAVQLCGTNWLNGSVLPKRALPIHNPKSPAEISQTVHRRDQNAGLEPLVSFLL